MGLVNVLYGLGQVIISLDCTMNIKLLFKQSGAKGFPGTNQVHGAPDKPSGVHHSTKG